MRRLQPHPTSPLLGVRYRTQLQSQADLRRKASSTSTCLACGHPYSCSGTCSSYPYSGEQAQFLGWCNPRMLSCLQDRLFPYPGPPGHFAKGAALSMTCTVLQRAAPGPRKHLALWPRSAWEQLGLLLRQLDPPPGGTGWIIKNQVSIELCYQEGL